MSSMFYNFKKFSNIPCKLKENIKIFHYFKHDIFYYVYSNDNVFGFGEKIHQYVGRESNDEKFIEIRELCGKSIEEFYGGFDFFERPYFFAKCENDEIYSWGYNHWDELGLGHKSGFFEFIRPQKVQDLSNIGVVNISCGYAHGLAVTKMGSLYVWGENKWAQLGVGRQELRVKNPIVLDETFGIAKKVIFAHARGWSSIVVTHDGYVYHWGYLGCTGINSFGFGHKYRWTAIMLNVTNIDQVKFAYRHNECLMLKKNKKILIFDCEKNYILKALLGDFCDLLYIRKKVIIQQSNQPANILEYEKDTAKLKTSNFNSINQYCMHHGQIAKSIQVSDDGDFFENIVVISKLDEDQLILTKKKRIIESKLLSNFTIIKTLGEGGFGTVVEAINIFNNRKFAIKMIEIKYEKDYVKREIDLMIKLRSEYVVRYIDSWMETENKHDILKIKLYIQMELCSMSLKQLLVIHHENFKFLDFHFFISCKLFRQLTQCVNYLHNYSIIHRDLKPDNVLVSINVSKHFLKLCDFGLSVVHDISIHSQNVGTQSYMAPEVRLNQKYNIKSDIYSLALIAIQIFNIENNISNLKKHKSMDIYRENVSFGRNKDNYHKLLNLLSDCIFSEEYDKRPSSDLIMSNLDILTNVNFMLENPNDYISFSEIINLPCNCYFKKLLEKDSPDIVN